MESAVTLIPSTNGFHAENVQDSISTRIHRKSYNEVNITKQFPFNVWLIFPRELGEQIFKHTMSDIGDIDLLEMKDEQEFFGRFTGTPEVFDKRSPVRAFAIGAVLETNVLQSSNTPLISSSAILATIQKLGTAHRVRRLKIMLHLNQIPPREDQALIDLILSLPDVEEVEYRGYMRYLSDHLRPSVIHSHRVWSAGRHFASIVKHPRLQRVVMYDLDFARTLNDYKTAEYEMTWSRLLERWEGIFKPQERRVELVWRRQ